MKENIKLEDLIKVKSKEKGQEHKFMLESRDLMLYLHSLSVNKGTFSTQHSNALNECYLTNVRAIRDFFENTGYSTFQNKTISGENYLI